MKLCNISASLVKAVFKCNLRLRPATLLKKTLWHRCFPVNFAKFLRTPFLTEHLRRLLLFHHRHMLLLVVKLCFSVMCYWFEQIYFRLGWIRSVLKKRCSENMQQIYRRILMPKYHFIEINFIEITLRHRNSPVNLLHVFRTHFDKNTSGDAPIEWRFRPNRRSLDPRQHQRWRVLKQ